MILMSKVSTSAQCCPSKVLEFEFGLYIHCLKFLKEKFDAVRKTNDGHVHRLITDCTDDGAADLSAFWANIHRRLIRADTQTLDDRLRSAVTDQAI